MVVLGMLILSCGTLWYEGINIHKNMDLMFELILYCEVNPHKGRNLVNVHGTGCHFGHPLPLIFGIVGNGRVVIKLRGMG